MKTFGACLTVSIAASLLFLLLRFVTAADWPVSLELLSIFLLAVPGFRLNTLLGIALMLSLVGDLFLGVHRLGSLNSESLFMFGLTSFLLAHLVYIVMFRGYWPANWWRPGLARICGVLAILVLLGSLLTVLWHSLDGLLIPVVLYSLALSSMGISAMLADLDSPMAAFGALSFIISDAIISVSKFHGHVPGSGALIWITYYSAQVLILLGVSSRHRRLQSQIGLSD
jgi:uncharacterized membrane protein YhhN